MALEFSRLNPTIGAEVRGIDCAHPPSEEAQSELLDGLRRFGVLIFREQEIDDGQQVAFCRQFGELEVLPEAEKRKAEHPEVMNLTSVKPDGTVYGEDEFQGVFLRGTEHWHTDSSYREIPALASVLYAVEVPEEGGDTEFANMYAAYEGRCPRKASGGWRGSGRCTATRTRGRNDRAWSDR